MNNENEEDNIRFCVICGDKLINEMNIFFGKILDGDTICYGCILENEEH